MKSNPEPSNRFEDLRLRAEALLNRQPSEEAGEIIQDLSKLAYELQVSHAEKEIQNQDLRDTQLRLQATRSEYHDLFNLAPVAILTLDRDICILRINETGRQWFGEGLDADHVHFNQFIAPRFRGPFLSFMESVFLQGGRHKHEIQVHDRDGLERWVTLTAIRPDRSWVHHAVDREVCMVAMTDVTALKLVQKELRQNEEQSRAVVEAMGDSLFIFDRNGRLVEINPAACRLFGHPRDHLLKASVSDLLPVTEHRLMAHIRSSIREKGSFEGRSSIRKTDGSIRRVSLNCVMFLFRGNPHTLTLVRDIEDQIQAQRDLNRAAVVFEQSSQGILISDSDHRLTMVNDAAVEISGHEREDLLGQDFFALLCEKDSSPSRIILDSLSSTGKWSGEVTMRRGGGESYLAWMSLVRVFDTDSLDQNFIAMFHDLTEHRRAEDRIRQLAHFDPLTGLPNRALFQDRLDQALTHARRDDSHVALLFLDLDNFKAINDSLGHQAGDQLLEEVAERLRGCVRDEDTIARMGGDEFTILLGDLSDAAVARRIAARVCGLVLDTFAEPIHRGGHEMFTDGSIGIALFPEDADQAEDLVRCADTAMYAAKKAGKGTSKFFSEGMDRQARKRLDLETGLRHALNQNELQVFYQPIVEAGSGQFAGLEALLRWLPSGGRLLEPGAFIEVAEETGVIVPIGHWVLREVAGLGKLLLDEGKDPGRLGVNISSRQLMEPGFEEFVRQVLHESGLPPENLEIEVCERTILQDLESSCRVLNHLRDMKITVALDDFGTGYSSLRYLKQLPIDRLKIDRAFIANMEDDPQDQAIVRTIIELGHNLGLAVVAEGVERDAQARWLAENGCHQMQGFYFGKPMPGNEAREAVG